MLPSSSSLENIPYLWEQNDILIFLIDLDDYDRVSMECLNSTEKEHLEKLKTKYFKKRYVVSRVVLKHILCYLLKKKSIMEISTYKDEYGKVHILNHKEMHICISYSKNITTLAVSKVRIGIDIEDKRQLALKSTLKYLQTAPLHTDGSEIDSDFLKVWTMKEAYCKLSNKSMLSILNKEPDCNNAYSLIYLLDNKYIFSIVTDPDPHVINISRLEKIDYC